MGIFFWVFVVLAALWLVLWLGVHVTSFAIHVLIILAVISLIVHFVRGSSRTAV